MVKYNDLALLSGQRGVEQFTRKRPAGVRYHYERSSELAALRLADCQRISEFQALIAVLAEIRSTETELEAELGCELNF